MNEGSRTSYSAKKQNIFARISDKLNDGLKNGFFGRLMSSYPEVSDRTPKKKSALYYKVIAPVRAYFSKCVDRSVMIDLFSKIKDALLACRLRAYGTFFMSFGVYSALIVAFRHFVLSDGTMLTDAVIPVITAVSSLPLVFAKTTLSSELISSRIGERIREYTGFRTEAMTADRTIGRSNVAFALGLLLGMLTVAVPAAKIIIALAVILLACAVLASPEIGVVSLFFFIPWMKTLNVLGYMLFILAAFAVKVIRGKRAVRFGRVDAAVAFFGLLMMLGGIIPGTDDSGAAAIVYTVFLLGYFLTVQTMKSRKWIGRAVYSAVASAALISLYAAVGRLIPLVEGVPFIDYDALVSFFDVAGNMFGDARMLSDYFVFIFPLAVGYSMSSDMTSRHRLACFLVALLIIACTLLDFGIGAACALVLSLAFIMLVRNHRLIYLFVLIAAAAAAVTVLFPDTVSAIAAVIVPDESAFTFTYTGRVWDGARAMISDHFVSGIGLGNGAWSHFFPQYAVGTVSDAPHAHSLYLQILSTLGVFGLLTFVVAVLYLFSANFTYLCRLSSKSAQSGLIGNEQTERTLRRSYAATKSEAAAPLASVVGALVLGISDSIWYNYRLYFMFWLVFALAVSYARAGTAELDLSPCDCGDGGKNEAEITINLN